MHIVRTYRYKHITGDYTCMCVICDNIHTCMCMYITCPELFKHKLYPSRFFIPKHPSVYFLSSGIFSYITIQLATFMELMLIQYIHTH